MIKSELIKEIEELNINEKLQLVEDIWNSIANQNNEIPFHEWQKVEMDKRYNEYKSGKYSLHEVREVHTELRKNKN